MARKILVIGSGKSTSYLYQYLLNKSQAENLQIIAADKDPSALENRLKNHVNCTTLALDISHEKERQKAIKEADIIISMLPAHLHIKVAHDCLHYNKHLVTASYISPELKALHKSVTQKGLVFLNEIGLDPGIDHMSAMQVIDRIKNAGGKMLLFESFTGGLVAPDSDNNLWNYKFTWNPRNVVIAGQGGAAKFIQEGTYKYIPYHKLFRRT
jgi:saccharopine dehydrogenase-like NADP-dependent oxidoreductase